jgi:serine/threonine protein phosphatase PrpC
MAFPPPPLNLKKMWESESPKDEEIIFAPDVVGCTKRGPVRNYNEDRIAYFSIAGGVCMRLCAVVDGHGGSEFAEYIKQNLPALGSKLKDADLEQAKLIITEELIKLEQSAKHLQGGACFLILIETPSQILFASTGDCCAIVLNKDGTMCLPVTKHAPDNEHEKKRITEANLKVFSGRVWNESGQVGLNVSRSMGDFDLKGSQDDATKQAVTVVPEFAVIDKDQVQKCLLTSDGILESLSREEVLAHMSLGDSAEYIINKAIELNSTDNCSAIMLSF